MSKTINFPTNLNCDNSKFNPAFITILERLHQSKAFIQAQPIGMMRLALGQQNNNQEGLFLHVWSPDLPKQASGGPFIHTHVFDLQSRVIKGTIIDTTYEFIADGNGPFKLVEGECKQNFCSLHNGVIKRGRMQMTNERALLAGETYTIPKGEFHITSIGGDGVAITLMKKMNVDNTSPLIAVPNDLNISLEKFDRNQLNQQSAWDMLKSILQIDL